jgi:hypothetical protein
MTKKELFDGLHPFISKACWQLLPATHDHRVLDGSSQTQLVSLLDDQPDDYEMPQTGSVCYVSRFVGNGAKQVVCFGVARWEVGRWDSVTLNMVVMEGEREENYNVSYPPIIEIEYPPMGLVAG